MSKRIPVTVVTGFLGAGKTTLLRYLLTHSHQRLAVMVNEFGSVGLDGDLIRSCGFCSDEEIDGRLVELNNGCLCCTVQDDFLPMMEKLLSKADSLDGIVVETSGLALPRPLLQALEWPAIRAKVHVNGVVTVVDGEALASGSPVGDLSALDKQRQDDTNLDHLTPVDELFTDQLSAADLVLITRSDLLTSDSLNNIKLELMQKVRAGTQIISISFGKIDTRLILGLQHSSVNNSFHGHEHDDQHDIHDHQHVEIQSGSIRLEGIISRETLESLLKDLAVRFEVVRLKGRCWLPHKSLPLQLQMVGPRLSSWFEMAPDNVWTPTQGGVDLVVFSFKEEAVSSISSQIEQSFCV